MMQSVTRLRRLSILAAAAIVILSPISLGAQVCDWDIGAYAGIVDYPDEGMTEIYAYAWDSSPCAGQCGHSGYLIVEATYDYGGGSEYYSDDSQGSLVFASTTTGTITYDAVLAVWCNCAQSYAY